MSDGVFVFTVVSFIVFALCSIYYYDKKNNDKKREELIRKLNKAVDDNKIAEPVFGLVISHFLNNSLVLEDNESITFPIFIPKVGNHVSYEVNIIKGTDFYLFNNLDSAGVSLKSILFKLTTKRSTSEFVEKFSIPETHQKYKDLERVIEQNKKAEKEKIYKDLIGES